MGILSANDFKRRFSEALPASDQNLMAFLQEYGQEMQGLITQAGGWRGPDTITGELISPESGLQSANVQSTGINSNVLLSGERTADKARGSTFYLSAHQCSSCIAPQEAAKTYSCDDLKDPFQIRGGQLMRMAVGLHELGHVLYDPGKTEPGVISRDQSYHLGSNQNIAEETHADLFMGITMINQLGPEGLAFVRQYADGMRGQSGLTFKRHDSINSLAMLIEAAEEDITQFTKLEPHQLNAIAIKLTAEFMPSAHHGDVLYRALSQAKLNPFDYTIEPVERAEKRLEWFDEQKKLKEAGKPVDERALNIYEKYYRRGDKAMMYAEDWEANHGTMVDLSPLSKDTSWLPEAEQRAAICHAQSSTHTPKPE